MKETKVVGIAMAVLALAFVAYLAFAIGNTIISDGTGGVTVSTTQACSHCVQTASTTADADYVVGNDAATCGTTIDDNIVADDGDDVIYTQGGIDTIDAGAGNDYVDAGDCGDTIYGGNGDDTLLPGKGNDTINAGAGDDVIYIFNGDGPGTGNTETITCGDGTDTVYFIGFPMTWWEAWETAGGNISPADPTAGGTYTAGTDCETILPFDYR